MQRDDRGSSDYDYDAWTVEGERLQNAHYIGAAGGAPVFYSDTDDELIEGDLDRESSTVSEKSGDPREGLDLSPGESIGDAIRRIGDEIGWDSLSEFGEDHSGDRS